MNDAQKKVWENADKEFEHNDESDCGPQGDVCDEHLCSNHLQAVRELITDGLETLANRAFVSKLESKIVHWEAHPGEEDNPKAESIAMGGEKEDTEEVWVSVKALRKFIKGI